VSLSSSDNSCLSHCPFGYIVTSHNVYCAIHAAEESPGEFPGLVLAPGEVNVVTNHEAIVVTIGIWMPFEAQKAHRARLGAK